MKEIGTLKNYKLFSDEQLRGLKKQQQKKRGLYPSHLNINKTTRRNIV